MLIQNKKRDCFYFVKNSPIISNANSLKSLKHGKQLHFCQFTWNTEIMFISFTKSEIKLSK